MQIAAMLILALLGTIQGRGEENHAPPKELAQMNHRDSAQVVVQPPVVPGHLNHAETTVTVLSSRATPFDQGTGPALIELQLTEIFAGEIDGKSTARALEVRRDQHSTTLVSMQRFVGKLGSREGTFVLQGSETVVSGKIEAKWSVVPGSATGQLSGLRGEGGFKGDFGKGSRGTLDYWFE